jgi:HD-like signal output (HDOD) protein
MSKHLLLVDDEPMVLTGLQRSLRSMRDEWEMECAIGGVEALEVMARQPIDVIVTDMRMPGMDGAQLLNEVRRRSPETVRVALSGQCDRQTVMSAIGSTHQYISKPCDAQQLKDTINHAIALRNELQTANVTKTVSKLKTIPSLPASYQAMLAELSSSEPRLDKLATLVTADMGMAAKCLQLVNSAFFGLRTPVSGILHALNLLGLDLLKSLVLSTHVFSEFSTSIFKGPEIGWLWDHSFAVSLGARKIAEIEQVSPLAIDEASTAGLLHEVGKLVLASCLGNEYRMALDMATETGITLREAEQEVFGCNQAQVGAYLLGLWGLSDGVIEAVAWHLKPSAAPPIGAPKVRTGMIGSPVNAEAPAGRPPRAFSPLTAVHAACAFHSGKNPSRLSSGLVLDKSYLEGLGMAGRETVWNEGCAESLTRGRGRSD